LSKDAKSGAKRFSFGKKTITSRIKILDTHDFLGREFATVFRNSVGNFSVCLKIATFCPVNFLTHSHRCIGLTISALRKWIYLCHMCFKLTVIRTYYTLLGEVIV